MIRNLIFIFLCLVFLPWNLSAQNFYYAPEGKTSLSISTKKILVQFNTTTNFETQKQFFEKFKQLSPLSRDMMLPAPELTLLDIENISSEKEIYELLKKIEQAPQVKYANHFLVHADGTLHGIMDRVLVKLKSAGAYKAFALKMREHPNVETFARNPFDPLLMELEVKGDKNALALANELHESALYAFAEPDFLRIMKRFNTNDPSVDNQWSLNNDGQNTSQWGGTVGADMSVYDAWATTTGSANVKVAILDEGVDLNHPDLVANMEPGFDATGLGSGGDPTGNDAHGTACAGIVAAVGNNNLGGTGVAYQSRIVPVRIAYSDANGNWVTSNAWIGNAINWSWNQGDADILSNSWGGGGSSSTINGAIDNAIANGRGGLGSPVLFAAGNNNGANSYPATYAPTISVIAMSMCNERKNPSSCDGETWWGSNFGTGADVAAPGVKIFATDISGSAGYSNGDYTGTFNGTSSATPNAAGVMALILAMDNTLTEAQARFTLESTTDKVGGYSYNANVNGQPNGTWSNDLGYGRVNAEAAVLSLAANNQYDAGITGIVAPSGTVCATSATPEVALRNFGSETLNSVTINYSLDGGANSSYNWTGSLATNATTIVSLPNISFASGAHSFSASTSNPNAQPDANTSNDGASTTFASGSNDLTLTIVLDQYPQETSWEVRNAANQVVASGGNYTTANTTVVENICVENACFDFNIFDSFGDGICCQYGNGSYSLADANGNVLASGGQFTNSETTNFCVPVNNNPLAISLSSTDVSCFGGDDGSATVTVTGGTGNYTYSWSNGGASATINAITAGTYTVTVSDGNTSETGSVSVQDGPTTTYYADADSDGFGDNATTIQGGCTPPAGYVTDNTDCDDTNPLVYPTAPEFCDGIDNNCNGQIDESGTTVYYRDADGDGFGDFALSTISCNPPAGYVTDNTDCDDSNAAVYPNAPELCDGIDNNCDGQTDEGVQNTYYADVDGDGFGDANNTTQACSTPTGYVTDNTDCDDTNPAVYPNAPEVCDGVDNDCNGQVDENGSTTFYADADGDGFGDANTTKLACSAPAGYVADDTDCDDSNAAVYPNAPELCDGIDNNCNGQTDEGVQNTYYADADGDGFGDANNTTQACSAPTGYVTDNTDCDDNDANVYIGATCDDGDPNTTGDVIDGNCTCAGTPVTGCTENTVSLSLNLDNYPQETTWTLTDAAGTVLHSGGTYPGQQGVTIAEDFCLADGCYTFTINDSFGDGICCAYGNGSYSLVDANGNVLAAGGAFGSSEATDFCFGAVVYCGSQGNNQNYEYIEAVSIGSINNTSGNNNGYVDFTNLSTTASAGQTVSVSLTPGFASSAYNENWSIWVDYNQDGDFEDAGEQVFVPAASNTTVSGAFTIPATAVTGATRMRVSMKWNGAAGPCESFTYGEVEDYKLVISGTGASNMLSATNGKVGTVGQALSFTEDQRGELAMTLYPNPVQDILTLEVSLSSKAAAQIRITTLSGQTVLNQLSRETAGQFFREEIQLGTLPAGLYFISIINGEEIITQRFSKVK